MRATRGDDLRVLFDAYTVRSWPTDVQTMYRALITDANHINVGNDGTAMRFLTAYFAQKEGREVVLDGCARMRERPMAQLVTALRSLGADITYLDREGYAPLRISGRRLEKKPVELNNPLSTQFVSALLLIGVDVRTNKVSPYIDMTCRLMAESSVSEIEPDWSAAAFWLERKALGLIDEVVFPGLCEDSLQGDKVVKQVFADLPAAWNWDFSSCPDLYPAVAVTCHLLGIHTAFRGTESLRLKESDRIRAVEEGLAAIDASPDAVVKTYGDHRIAMAFLAAGFRVDDEACCAKSYPDFVMQLRGITRVVPRRGINDDNKGKKWALHKLIRETSTEWIWLADDDVIFPTEVPSEAELSDADMLILPLRMQASEASSHVSLLVRLQQLEYDAIQALTIQTALRGHAVMCSGANILVRREVWLALENELHPDIPSGDDMFLLEAMKRHHLRVRAINKYDATCFAEPTLRGLLRQRMRWAGKAPHYRDADILVMGAFTVLSNLLAVLCPVWLIGKWIADVRLIQTRTKITAKIVVDALLLTLVYPWYMLICLIGGFFRKKW